MPTTTQKVGIGFAAAIAATGAFVMTGTTETIPVGESRITTQAANHEIVVTKTTEANKEVRVFKRKFDRTTGQEITPDIFVFNTDSLNSDIVGKQTDIARIQTRIAEATALIQGATGDSITISTPQFDTSTGEALPNLDETLLIADVQKEIDGANAAVTEITNQIAELQLLIDEANKIQ